MTDLVYRGVRYVKEEQPVHARSVGQELMYRGVPHFGRRSAESAAAKVRQTPRMQHIYRGAPQAFEAWAH